MAEEIKNQGEPEEKIVTETCTPPEEEKSGRVYIQRLAVTL